ncbi:TPA: hypothetical protein PXM42_001547 [Yersinia enterocolitica]|nr:hypothetical protein [Yersinia enterocolitica]
MIEVVFRDFLQAKDFADEVNAHAPGAPLDVPMGEFVNAASSIAVARVISRLVGAYLNVL